MKWIGSNLFILSTKDVILYGANITTINTNKIMKILITNIGNYNDSVSITNNNNNNDNYNKNNNS